MIRMQNVHKAFGDNRVLRGLDLHIPKGTSMVIIGGSGHYVIVQHEILWRVS